MALLKQDLYRQVEGPEVTHADRCTLVFDTDSKSLYVERNQTATMDIADYLKQGGHTAGHRELWRLLRTILKQDSDPDQAI